MKNNLWMEMADAKRNFPVGSRVAHLSNNKRYLGTVEGHFWWFDLGYPAVMVDVQFDTIGKGGYDPLLLEKA